jgi:hypothetical protein
LWIKGFLQLFHGLPDFDPPIAGEVRHPARGYQVGFIDLNSIPVSSEFIHQRIHAHKRSRIGDNRGPRDARFRAIASSAFFSRAADAEP